MTHCSTISRRFGFSMAAATLSLSLICLLTAKHPAQAQGAQQERAFRGAGLGSGERGRCRCSQHKATMGNNNSCHFPSSGKGCEVFQWLVPKPRVKFRVNEWPRFSLQPFNHNIPFLAGTERSGHCWDRAWLWLGRTPRSCQPSCKTCLRNIQIWCGDFRTVGPTAEAAPHVDDSIFVTNTCQNWGALLQNETSSRQVVTEPPQPGNTLMPLGLQDLKGIRFWGGRGAEDRAQEAEAAACTGSTHCPPLWNVCPQKCRFPAGGEISSVRGTTAVEHFPPGRKTPSPLPQGCHPCCPRGDCCQQLPLQCSAGSVEQLQNQNHHPKTNCSDPQLIDVFFTLGSSL